MYNLVIAGSREFSHERFLTVLHGAVTHFESQYGIGPDVTVISGGARGMDTIGEMYAQTRGWQVRRFPADWAKHGKMAGPLRNHAMADVAHGAVVLCLNDSRGSHHMWQCVQKRELPGVLVVLPRVDGQKTFNAKAGTWLEPT